MLYKKEFECSSCGLRFERVECAETKTTGSRCPVCGSAKATILNIEEKEPASLEESARHICS